MTVARENSCAHIALLWHVQTETGWRSMIYGLWSRCNTHIYTHTRTEYLEMFIYITYLCLSRNFADWRCSPNVLIIFLLFFSVSRVCVCQSPSDGEGCFKGDWRRPQRQQLSVCQWKVRHYKEHRCKFAPFKKGRGCQCIQVLDHYLTFCM